MASNQGRHRVARRTTIATGVLGLTIAVGAIVVSTTAGEPGQAGADEVNKALFVDIKTVQPNVKPPNNKGNASTGTFTVNCGTNQNGHFNPDNFIAQPGIKNGAQHLHDYVGNLSTNAESNNKSLLQAGTTCKNGDQSAYFWPVVRIDTGEAEKAAANPKGVAPDAERVQAAKDAAAPRVDCPDVASALPEVPDGSMDAVNAELDAMDQQAADADEQLAADQGKSADQVLKPLKDKRSRSIDKINAAMAQNGADAGNADAVNTDDAQQLATCAVKDPGAAGIDNGAQNSDPAKDTAKLGVSTRTTSWRATTARSRSR
ncbi:hypothetical protein [Amycolatopsis sp. H20-H5]|uniref:hypothetical protein n=1 Tax=Amycolatopsis sp. H20-H5 TaxID=3046309 RepID=UPI003FA3C8CF